MIAGKLQNRILLVGIFFFAGAKIYLLTRLNINWDEFYFLHNIYRFQEGLSLSTLQTFHVHLYSWLTYLPQDESGQILVGRVVHLLFYYLTGYILYLYARLFINKTASLFAVFCFFSFSTGIIYGDSFRYDPLITLLSFTSLYLIAKNPGNIKWHTLVGALLACSLLVSLKTAFYIVLISTALLFSEKGLPVKKRIGRLISLGISVLLFYLPTLIVHSMFIVHPENGDRLSPFGIIKKMFLDNHLFERTNYLKHNFIENPLVWLLLVTGIVYYFFQWKKFRIHPKFVYFPLASLLLLSAFFIYKNAFPYCYIFVTAPLFLFSGFAFVLLMGKTHRIAVVYSLLTLFIGITGILRITLYSPDRISHQQMIIKAIHQIYPEPVPYLDRCGMISSFPRIGPFLSNWGLSEFKNREKTFSSMMQKEGFPHFILENTHNLNIKRYRKSGKSPSKYIGSADYHLFSNNYVQLDGPLFVIGQYFPPRKTSGVFTVQKEGTYQLVTGNDMVIDGRGITQGEEIDLTEGSHTYKKQKFYTTELVFLTGKIKEYKRKSLPRKIFDGFGARHITELSNRD